jgi:hypothetical protein
VAFSTSGAHQLAASGDGEPLGSGLAGFHLGHVTPHYLADTKLREKNKS